VAPSIVRPAHRSHDRVIVMVIGPGRSGTSTMAGALTHSGFEVPGRAIRGDQTNPSGFYEPRWVVDYHRGLLKQLKIGTIDPSPRALDVVSRAVAGSEARARLRDWLSARLEQQPRLVVKDPRSVWFQRMWIEVAEELGAATGYVTMLRHPAEVSASRRRYYGGSEAGPSRAKEIGRVAGWANGLLAAELASRDAPRAFVRYSDLIVDWRAALAPVGESLDIDFDPGLEQSPHPVDGFVDPSLRRIEVGWADLDVPAALRELAEDTWVTLSRFTGGADVSTLPGEADRLRAAYGQMFADAKALTRREVVRDRAAARRRGYRKGRQEALARPSPDSGSRLRRLLRRDPS
jgi:hypothetical protein